MQPEHQDNQNGNRIQQSSLRPISIDQMTQQQLLEYQRQLMAEIIARRQQKLQGKVEEQKYEQEYERPPILNEQRISQSLFVNPNQLNNSLDRQPSQHDTTFPTTMQKKNNNLRSTRASSQQSSQNSFSQSNNFSDYLTNGNVSQEQSTLDHTGNTSNFSYKTVKKSNEHQNFSNLLENVCDQSSILAQSQPSLDYSQTLKLSAQFTRQFNYLRCPKNQQNLRKALKSQQNLRSWNLFVENKDNGLFKMDLVSKNGISINEKFFQRLKQMDLFLLYRIQIGSRVKLDNLIKLLEIDFQSGSEISLQRIWDNNKQGYQEHGLDIIKNVNNQKRLVKIEWKSDKLTNKLVESFKDLFLISLTELRLNFTEKVQNEESYGDLLQKLFQFVDNKNEVSDGFKIYLQSSVKKIQNLGRSIENYEDSRLILTNVQRNQVRQVEVQAAQPQQVQQPVQQQRPAQQIQQPVQQPQPPQPQIIPSQLSPQQLLSNQLFQQLSQQLLTLQQQSVNQNPLPNNSQGQVVHNYGGVNVSPSNHSTLNGGVNVGSTSNTYNTNKK